MKNTNCEFTFYKLIAHKILGLGSNLCLWGIGMPGYVARVKKLFSMVEFFLTIDMQR